MEKCPVDTLIFPITTYAAETTVVKASEKRIVGLKVTPTSIMDETPDEFTSITNNWTKNKTINQN